MPNEDIALDPINQISHYPLGHWRVLLARFFCVVTAGGRQSNHPSASLRNSALKILHYDVRRAIISKLIQATAARGYQNVSHCVLAFYYQDAVTKYTGDALPSLLVQAFARSRRFRITEGVSWSRPVEHQRDDGITGLLIPDEMADPARAHLQSPCMPLDPSRPPYPSTTNW